MANRNFGKLSDTGELIPAPDTLGDSLRAPSADEYLDAEWLPVVYNVPEIVDGMVARFTGWTDSGGSIRREYVYEQSEASSAPVKRYSKKKFDLALAKLGIFAEFDEWASSTEVVEGSGLTVSRMLLDSWYMSSTDPEFIALKEVAESRFGTESIADVLAESEDDEW